MLSKELFSEVIGRSNFQNRFKLIEPIVSKNSVKYLYDSTSQDYISINIYELAHKCKEWALEKGFTIVQYNTWGNTVKCLLYPSDKVFVDEYLTRIKADTELEAIFQACQWILENIL